MKPSSSSYARVVGLEKSNLDALFLEETFGLSQVERCVVRRSVPACAHVSRSNPGTDPREQQIIQCLPVGEERDLIGRHFCGSRAELQESVGPSYLRGYGGFQEANPFAGIIQIKFTGISQTNSSEAPCPRATSAFSGQAR